MRNLSILAAAALLASACGSDPRTVTDADPEVARVAAENNAFTLDIYEAIADADEGNVFLSPFSMNAALSMTYAGAVGDTATEMEQVLRMEAGADHHGPLGAVLRDLSGDYRRDYQLRAANRIWGQIGDPWQQDFLDITREDYGAETVLTDISADPDGTRREINAWVADQTEDRIEELLPQGSMDASTPMVLVNAIYFKADWAESFDKKDTTSDPFTLADGSTVNVDRMHSSELADIKWADADGYTLAGLPYGEDADLRLWIVLPDTHDGLDAVVDGLDAAALDDMMDQAPAGDASIALPKLEMRTKAQLKQPLSDLGMPLAFSSNADFSGMRAGGGLYIDEVYHEAFVLMDEKGTEAAAATAVVTRELSAGDERILDVSHPYLFLIRDELTGAVLFIGRVADPSLTGPA